MKKIKIGIAALVALSVMSFTVVSKVTRFVQPYEGCFRAVLVGTTTYTPSNLPPSYPSNPVLDVSTEVDTIAECDSQPNVVCCLIVTKVSSNPDVYKITGIKTGIYTPA